MSTEALTPEVYDLATPEPVEAQVEQAEALAKDARVADLHYFEGWEALRAELDGRIDSRLNLDLSSLDSYEEMGKAYAVNRGIIEELRAIKAFVEEKHDYLSRGS